MADIRLVITTDSSGAITGLQSVGGALGDLNAKAETSGTGLASFGSGLLDAAKNVMGLGAALGGAGALVDQVNNIGVASLRAHAGLEAMSNGHADEFLQRMMTSTRGLVDDTELMQKATFALSTGVATTGDDLSKLAEDGAALGRVFGNDAAGGIDQLTRALQMTGQTRSLRGLGVDVGYVQSEFARLKGTMSDESAWKMAVMEGADATVKRLGDSAYGAGTALERLKIKAADAFEGFAERASQGVEGLLKGLLDVNTALDELGAKEALKRQAAGTILSADLSKPEVQMINTQDTLRTSQINNPTLAQIDAARNAAEDAANAPVDFGAIANQSDQGYGAITQGVNIDDLMAQMQTGRSRRAGASSGTGTQNSTAMVAGDIANIRAQLEGLTGPITNFSSNTQKIHDLGQGISHWWSETSAGIQRGVAPLQAQVDAANKLNQLQTESVKQVLGVKGNNLASDFGSGMASALGGFSSGKGNQAGDALQAQAAMDKYNLAMGITNKAEIALRDTQSDLNAQLKAGKLLPGEYADEMIKLEKSFEGGTTSAQGFLRMQQEMDLKNAKPKEKLALARSQRADQADNIPGGATSATGDPYAPIKKSADDAASKTDALTASSAKVGPASLQAGIQGALAWAITAGGASLANSQVSSVATSSANTRTNMAQLGPTGLAAGVQLAAGASVAAVGLSATAGQASSALGTVQKLSAALKDATSHAWNITVSVSGGINGAGEVRGP